MSTQESDGWYAHEWELAGTNTGEGLGLPATTKPYRFRGVTVGHLDSDGKISEERSYFNGADFLTQLGLLPTLGT